MKRFTTFQFNGEQFSVMFVDINRYRIKCSQVTSMRSVAQAGESTFDAVINGEQVMFIDLPKQYDKNAMANAVKRSLDDKNDQ